MVLGGSRFSSAGNGLGFLTSFSFGSVQQVLEQSRSFEYLVFDVAVGILD